MKLIYLAWRCKHPTAQTAEGTLMLHAPEIICEDVHWERVPELDVYRKAFDAA